MGDIDIDALREENLKNVEVGIDGSTHTYYINGVPYQSKELKDQVLNSKFSIPQGLRTRAIEENMNDEEKERMELMAEMVDIVYARRKAFNRPLSSLRGSVDETEKFNLDLERRQLYRDINKQNVGDYILQDTGNDLTALFVNKNKKESVLAIRGLMPFEDYKDRFQLGEMIAYTFMETENAERMGMEYKNDRDIVRRTYNLAKEQYPDHKLVLSGHSRGGKLTLNLGREKDIEYHAFSPAGNRADFIDSTPQRGGRLYYHTNDPVSLFHHKGKGRTEEQHYEMFNSRTYTHDLRDFYKNERSAFFKHPVKPLQQEIEKEILLDMKLKTDEVPTGEEMVLSDLGLFEPLPPVNLTNKNFVPSKALVPYVGLREETPEPVFKSQPIYFDSLDTKKKNTIALNKDVPSERTIFNEYMPSVFTDINIKPAKKFEPITFEQIDGDKNDKISLKELNDFLSKRGYDEQTIKNLFETYDTDNDGNISRIEFTDLKQMV